MIKDCFLEEIRKKLKVEHIGLVLDTLNDIRRTGKSVGKVRPQEAGKLLFLLQRLDDGQLPGECDYCEF